MGGCLATPRAALAQAAPVGPEEVTNILWQFPGVPYSEIEPMLENLQNNNTLKVVSQKEGKGAIGLEP